MEMKFVNNAKDIASLVKEILLTVLLVPKDPIDKDLIVVVYQVSTKFQVVKFVILAQFIVKHV